MDEEAAADPVAADRGHKQATWDDPRTPWAGKPRRIDVLCWLGIVLSGVFYWAVLPFSSSRATGWVPTREARNGSTAQ